MAMAKGNRLQFELDDEDLKVFCDEADEQIELLDTFLVQLESQPEPELVQQIFRAAHTLKGSSATIGHKKMASLTHAMETVLDAVRQDRATPTAPMVDALLAALDALRLLAQEVVTRIDSGIDPAPLEADLLAILEADVAIPAQPLAADAGPPPLLDAEIHARVRADVEQGRIAYLVEVAIDAECQLPSIRCYQALQELDALAAIHITWPDRLTVEGGGADHDLRAFGTSSATDEQLHSALASISDVARVLVQRIDEEALATLAAEPPAHSAPTPISSAPRQTAPDVAVQPNEAARPPARKATQSVRIDVERLDGLMNLVGELVIDRTRLTQIREQLSSVLKDANLNELTDNFTETTSHLARITDELQEEIMRSRMLPIRSVLTRLPRLVRDVAAKCGKKVELVTSGEETELDRSVIEEISDPLVHILRNAIDHGIETPEERRLAGKSETGTVTVTAWNQEAYIYLSITDDGQGIDTATIRRKAVEKGLVTREAADAATDEQVLQYIFFAGLSTAKALSDVSGRGVGMDIVRTNIERLNGRVMLKSTRGRGSEFVIQLPLTLATTKALMVMAGETVYAMPLVSVTEALSEADADIHSVAGRRTLRLRGQAPPGRRAERGARRHAPPPDRQRPFRRCRTPR